ncbi:hypothetical protein AJ80_03465 [Polytolypa hystricis UAMH7299]|uniref:Uncharacterized protein n=1 Tax=Polytolypa hystricis (strain UAMH7299) TaxID=1447883 RepID=A0A2B7YIZ8_POLH7|nr:hypothetical protein AJ80_03465 [Polytolypa hystricis UAMH7299]
MIMEVGSHVNTLSLFHSPNKWSQADLSGLHIEEHDRTHAVTIVGFAALATDFAQPTKKEIAWFTVHDNQFWKCFDNIWQANDLSKEGNSIQAELDHIAMDFIRLGNSTHLISPYQKPTHPDFPPCSFEYKGRKFMKKFELRKSSI